MRRLNNFHNNFGIHATVKYFFEHIKHPPAMKHDKNFYVKVHKNICNQTATLHNIARCLHDWWTMRLTHWQHDDWSTILAQSSHNSHTILHYFHVIFTQFSWFYMYVPTTWCYLHGLAQCRAALMQASYDIMTAMCNVVWCPTKFQGYLCEIRMMLVQCCTWLLRCCESVVRYAYEQVISAHSLKFFP